MDKTFDLPSEISEIHLGFESAEHFIGTTDIGKCTELDISFEGREWIIRAVCNGKEIIKRYQKKLCAMKLVEITDKEKSAAETATE